MKALRSTLYRAALVLFVAGAALAGPVSSQPLPDFLRSDAAAAKSSPSKTPLFFQSAMQCVMTCDDGFRTFPTCSAPIATCCAAANNLGCASHGGLAYGSCTEGGVTQYC
jgi:hypothetical protein